MQNKANITSAVSDKEKDEAMNNVSEYSNTKAEPGSMFEKANMVKRYNEKNNK